MVSIENTEMGFLSLPILCLVVGFFCLLLYQRNLKCQRFWRERGVPLLDSIPFFGHKQFMSILSKSYFEIINAIYEEASRLKLRYCCIFQFSSPAVMLLDPQIIGNILTKDFEYFSERFDLPYSENQAISHQLFSACNAKWKELSKQVSPVVSPGRISFLIKEMEKIGKIDDLDSSDCERVVNVNHFAFEFNEKIVGQATLGIRLKRLTKNSLKLLKMVKQTIDPSIRNFFRFFLPLVFPTFKLLSVPKIDDEFLCDFVKDIIPFRRKFASHRNDVFQFFVDSQTKHGRAASFKTDSAENNYFQEDIREDFEKLKNLQDAEAVKVGRQLFWFLVDSQGTNTVALSFVLHLLSLHPECQEEIRQELEETLKGRGEHVITYQVVRDLKYTHTVVKECLRLYTPMSILHRVCTKDYQIPGTSSTIPKGTKIIIPIYSIQRDSKFFSDPFNFKPSRFNDLTKITPYTFMPFGEGPRFCIGYRFAMAHLKFTVASIVSKFHIEAMSTDRNILALHQLSPALLRAKETISVRFSRRQILAEPN